MTLLGAALICCGLTAQNSKITEDFLPVQDSLKVLLREKTTVATNPRITKILRRGNRLDFYFTRELGDFPWRSEDVRWLRTTLSSLFPEKYGKESLGEIFLGGTRLETLVTPPLGNDGKQHSYKYSFSDRGRDAFITRIGERRFESGLDGRIIALWQSHGRYFEEKFDRWEWQRAPCHGTVEDMYTQSYVLPFLIPMLENAGAYVMTPRERDTQVREIIADNDPSFTGERAGLMRRSGSYSENGVWSDAGEGFADAKPVYVLNENPFTMGTARKAPCILKGEKSEIRWTPTIEESGSYAVYISYKTLENSTSSAHYTVRHAGGETEFCVNQKMGGGTWIYLGTFEFEKGSESYVSLDNSTPAGHKFVKNSVVSADAVKFGGGVGKIARGLADTPVERYTTSGMPAFTEGAIYWMQWAGADSTLTRQWDDDYTQDYASRGAWVGMMSGGSKSNPKQPGKNIPVDLSFAFHTDAGTTPDDSTVGTLSIYTLQADGSDRLPNGQSRMSCRHLATLVSDQICDDVRSDFDPQWNKRMIWDRSYSESRTTSVPGMLLELLSHQNFADMKYGLDPSFRFTVSRAIYKGMLKFLSDLYSFDYTVQPLPVNSFAARLDGQQATLSWKPTEDSKEPTATPSGYILYIRVDDGVFDQGIYLDPSQGCTVKVAVAPGHLYSFKIQAYNSGGKSFPSEVLCVGTPDGAASNVLVVNNFDRVSAPTWFDTPQYAGFDAATDGGVAYGSEINFIGNVYQYRRSLPWMDDDNPGFGASYSDYAGKLVPGNTFDFVYLHAKALMASGYAVESSSRDAFTALGADASDFPVLDLLCGKQVTVKVGRGAVPNRFQVFPEALQKSLRDYTASGGNVLISGANIGTDVWDEVYPVQVDSAYRADTKAFVSEVLGYRWVSDHACYTGAVETLYDSPVDFSDLAGGFTFHQKLNPDIYCVENPDGILPVGEGARTVLRYTGNSVSAAVCADKGLYRVFSLGLPIESICDPALMQKLMKDTIDWLRAGCSPQVTTE